MSTIKPNAPYSSINNVKLEDITNNFTSSFTKNKETENIDLAEIGPLEIISDKTPLKYKEEKNNLNQSLEQLVKEGKFDFKEYNIKLNKELSKVETKREKAVVSALFIATIMPKMNYFWGGGHGKVEKGLDETWGQEKLVTAEGSETTNTYVPSSLDCSGYISWCFKQAGISGTIEDYSSEELSKLGQSYDVTEEGVTDKIKTGDLAYLDGHIGMIVNINKDEVTVAHISGTGKGTALTTVSTKTGLITKDETGCDVNRVGNKYFTNFISVDYEKM